MANEYIETLNKLTEAYRDLNASYTRERILSEQIKKIKEKLEFIKNHAYINKNNIEYETAKSALECINSEIIDKGLLIDKRCQMIKSADDLNEQKRQSDVLIKAIEKCEMLEKKLEIAVDALKRYRDGEWWYGYEWQEDTDGWEIAQKAIEQIKELDK